MMRRRSKIRRRKRGWRRWKVAAKGEGGREIKACRWRK